MIWRLKHDASVWLCVCQQGADLILHVNCPFCKECLVTTYWPDGSISGCNLLFVKCIEIPGWKDFCVKDRWEFLCYFIYFPTKSSGKAQFLLLILKTKLPSVPYNSSHWLRFCCNKQNVFDKWDNGSIVRVWMTALWQMHAEGCQSLTAFCIPHAVIRTRGVA